MAVPKGKLIAIGGKEARGPVDKNTGEARQVSFKNHGVLQHVLQEMKGPASKMAVITTASTEPDEMGEIYLKAFRQVSDSPEVDRAQREQ